MSIIECCHFICVLMLFKCVSLLSIYPLLCDVVCADSFKNGISEVYSPQAIFMNNGLDRKLNFKAHQIYNDTTLHNSPQPYLIDAICVVHRGNLGVLSFSP